MNLLQKLIREYVQGNLVDQVQEALSETGFALDSYGWSIHKYDEIGPGTISIVLRREDSHLPGKRRVSIRNSDLIGLENLTKGAWSKAGIEPENVNARDVGEGMVEVIVVVPDRESYITWEIP